MINSIPDNIEVGSLIELVTGHLAIILSEPIELKIHTSTEEDDFFLSVIDIYLLKEEHKTRTYLDSVKKLSLKTSLRS